MSLHCLDTKELGLIAVAEYSEDFVGVDFDIWVAADSGKSYMHEELMNLLDIERPGSFSRLNVLCIPFLGGPRVHRFRI